MTDIVDNLVIALGFDTSALVKGGKDASLAVEKTKTEVVKHATAIEGAIGKASDSFESLAGKVLAVFAIFAGARSIEQFTAKITSMDAAVGRLSASMGRSPDEVSAIGKAVERMGGSADTAMSGLRGLSDAFEDIRTKGASAIREPLAILQGFSGKSIEFGKDVHRNFLSIADALKAASAKDPALAHNLGRQILGSDDLVNLAIQGRAAVLAAEAKSRQLGVVTPQDAQAGQNLITTFRELSEIAEDVGRKILTAAEPALTAAMKAVEAWSVKNREWIQTGIVDAIRALIDWLQKIDWAAVGKQVSDFGAAFTGVGKAVDDLAKAFSPDAPLVLALTAFGAIITARVLGPLNAVILGLATLADQMHILQPPKGLSGRDIVEFLDPGLADRIYGPRGKADASQTSTSAPEAGGGDHRNWWQRTMPTWAGGKPDRADDKVRDDISATAEGVKALVKQGEKAQGGDGSQGVTVSSGGLGGSGRHVDGAGPGASLRDRQFHGKGNFGQKGWWTPERQSHAIDVLMKDGGLTEDGAKALVSRWMYVESPGGPTAVNPRSGASGIAQGLGSRKAGYTGSFDDQLKNAARELNSSEGRAKRMLNTPGQEAAGASQFERAEGYNAATGEDNFTARTREGMKHVIHGAPSTPGAGVPAPSEKAVTDADVYAARQRIINGSRDPKDRAIIDRYLKEQNTPKKTSFLDGFYRKAPAHVAGIAAGAQMAAHAAHITTTHHNDNSSETHIASMTINTQATDAQGIATDIGPALRRGQRAAAANYGLA